MCHVRTGDQRLGRGTSRVDTGAPQIATFNQGDCLAGFGEPAGERNTGLARADYDGVEVTDHMAGSYRTKSSAAQLNHGWKLVRGAVRITMMSATIFLERR